MNTTSIAFGPQIRPPEFQAGLLAHIFQEYITGAHIESVEQRVKKFPLHHKPANFVQALVIYEMTGVYGERVDNEKRVGYHYDLTVSFGNLKYALQVHYRKYGKILGFVDRVK